MKTKLSLLVLIVLLSQCRNVVDEMGDCKTLDLPQISYSVHVYPIISKTCAIPQCHTNDFVNGNFNRFEDLKKRADNGKLNFMIDSRKMPHSFTDGPHYLTRCDIEIIKKWISEGANNN